MDRSCFEVFTRLSRTAHTFQRVYERTYVAYRYYRNKASKRPRGCYDFAGVKRRPGAFSVRPGCFLKTYLGSFAPPGAIQKNKKKTHTSHMHAATALGNV